MFARILIFAVLAGLALGCAKKTAKNKDRSSDSVPAATPKPPAEQKTKTEAGEKPNWLTDPRAETARPGNQLPVERQPEDRGLGVKLPPPDPGALAPPPVNPGQVAPVNPPPAAALRPPSPSTPPTSTGNSPVTEADMKEVWIFIENFSGASGKMPPPALVYSALVKTEAKAANLVKDGSIVLAAATQRDSIWAFEKKALSKGGWAASQNGVENLTAAELKRRLGQ